jgi:RNA polymerase sigma-70 factor, ECF subfamily
VAPRLDPETVTAAKRLDPAAVAAIYDAFADPIFRYVSFRIRRPEDAEDLTDQVFLKMIEALPAYDDRGLPFAAWLYRIARNLIVDRYRRSAREPLALSDSLEAMGEEADPFATAAGNLDRQAVRAALGELTDEQREVVVLRFIEGWDVDEVAQAMGRRPGAIHALQHRALGALRRALSRSGAIG